MFKKGDIVINKKTNNKYILKIVGFYDHFNITYVVSKPLTIDDPDDRNLYSMPYNDLKIYEPYYRLKKLKRLKECLK